MLILYALVQLHLINDTLLELLTVKYTKAIDNFYTLLELPTFVYTIANDNFVWTIATDDYCMLQISINSVSCIDYNIYKPVAAL